MNSEHAANTAPASKFRIASGESRFEKSWKHMEVSVSELVERLGRVVHTYETVDQFHAMAKPKQDEIKDIGGYVGGTLKSGRRTSQSVANRTIVTLDIDHAEKMHTNLVLSRIAEALPDVSYCVHSTHKHKDTAPRLRFIGFIDRPAYPDEYEAMTRKLAESIGIELCDDSTFQPHRLMYWPSVSSDAQYVFVDRTVELDGSGRRLISVNEILGRYGEDEAWKDTSLWPVSSRASRVLMREIKRQEDPHVKRGAVGAFCRLYDIPKTIETFLPGVYRHEGGNRWTYTDGSSSKGLMTYEEGKFAFSFHSTDPVSNILCNAFDLLRHHKFGELDKDSADSTPANKLPSYVEMIGFVENLHDVRSEQVKSIADQFEKLTCSLSDEPKSTVDWMAMLHIVRNNIKPTYHNTVIIIENDENYHGKIWKDELCACKVYGGKGGVEWTNEHSLQARMYLASKYRMDVSEKNCADAIDHVAEKHAYHPVRDYLVSLEWDRVPRGETLWIDYLGEQDNAYTRQTARSWLLAAVSRAMEPGYKFDCVPVISGKQGIRKTTFCRILAKRQEWFGELRTVDPQRAVEAMKGKWIMELGELELNSRNEIEQVKAFLSATETTVRLPYRREPGRFPRQCVFIGTTNTQEYLKDGTGNRRWWPIDASEVYRQGECDIDTDGLYKTVDQLWAEAMEWYADLDATTELDLAALRIANQRAELKMPDDEWGGVIEAWLESKAETSRYAAERSAVAAKFRNLDDEQEIRNRVCVLEIWEDCLVQKVPMKRSQSIRIAQIMNAIQGWERSPGVRFGERYGRQRGWILAKGNIPV